MDDANKLETRELRRIELLLAARIESPNESWVILYKIFSGQPCTCFCKMYGGESLKIKEGAELYFVTPLPLNPRLEGENGSLFPAPANSEERTILSKDLLNSEILYLAAPLEKGSGRFSFGCRDAKGKVEINSPLEIAFMVAGKIQDRVEFVRSRRGNHYRAVRELAYMPIHG